MSKYWDFYHRIQGRKISNSESFTFDAIEWFSMTEHPSSFFYFYDFFFFFDEMILERFYFEPFFFSLKSQIVRTRFFFKNVKVHRFQFTRFTRLMKKLFVSSSNYPFFRHTFLHLLSTWNNYFKAQHFFTSSSSSRRIYKEREKCWKNWRKLSKRRRLIINKIYIKNPCWFSFKSLTISYSLSFLPREIFFFFKPLPTTISTLDGRWW